MLTKRTNVSSFCLSSVIQMLDPRDTDADVEYYLASEILLRTLYSCFDLTGLNYSINNKSSRDILFAS